MKTSQCLSELCQTLRVGAGQDNLPPVTVGCAQAHRKSFKVELQPPVSQQNAQFATLPRYVTTGYAAITLRHAKIGNPITVRGDPRMTLRTIAFVFTNIAGKATRLASEELE